MIVLDAASKVFGSFLVGMEAGWMDTRPLRLFRSRYKWLMCALILLARYILHVALDHLMMS